MRCLKLPILIFMLLSCSRCSHDYKSFILGTWEGRAQDNNGQNNGVIMYVSFKDGTLTVDSSPSGGKKRTAPYRFKNARTIETSLYPDNLVIEKLPNGALQFRPEVRALRVFIDMIYQCRFVRVGM